MVLTASEAASKRVGITSELILRSSSYPEHNKLIDESDSDYRLQAESICIKKSQIINQSPRERLKTKNHLLQVDLPDSHSNPKTLLDRFKSAIGASVWAPLNTSNHSIESRKPTSSPSQITTSSSFDHDLTTSSFTRSRNWNSSTPGRSTEEPIYHSRSPRPSIVSINHPTIINSSGSPIRQSPSNSYMIHSHSHLSSSNSLGPLSFTPESPRAPLLFPHHNHSNTFSMNSEAIMRNGMSPTPNNPGSQGLSNVPTFSQIPGFPLARETVADDIGSVLSSSIAPSSWKGAGMNGDETSQSNGHYQLMDRIQAEEQGLSKEYWMPDKDAKECYDCAVTFTSWRRKHHCRICGFIFCSRCASNLVSGQRFASTGYIRVCNICLAKLEPLPEPSWRVMEAEDENATTTEAGSSFNIFGSRSQAAQSSHKTSTTASRSREQAKSSVQSGLSQSTRRSSHRSSSRSRPDNRAGMSTSETSKEVEPAHTSLLRPKFRHASSNTLTIASRPSRRIENSNIPSLTAPFRKGLNDEDKPLDMKVTKHSQRLVTPTPSTLRNSRDTRRTSTERFPWFEHSKGIGELNLLVPDLKFDPFEHPTLPALQANEIVGPFDGEAINSQPDGYIDSLLTWPPWVSPPPGQAYMDDLIEPCFSPASLAHLRSMIRQSLHRDKVVKALVWESELTKLLIKVISDPPRPDQAEGEAADIHQLIKIKKIPGGQPQDSEYVHGVVFTKNVVHKKMRVDCINPRVLAISIPLEFQRVDGYSKLEPLIRQEKQYLKTLVNRLASLRPDVVLVEGNVSGLAIEYLVQAGVSVIRHVKPRVLQAIAHSTETLVISSLDKLLNLKVGQCDVFHVQTLDHRLIPGNRKSFVRLEGCKPELGGTLLLRGGNHRLLLKIKALMRMMVRISYSIRLETQFLRDEGAMMTPISEVHKSQLLNLDDKEVQIILTSFRRARRQLMQTKPPASKPGSPEKPNVSAGSASTSDLVRQIEDVLRPYECMILSGSPDVKLAPPVVLVKLRDLARQFNLLREGVKKPPSIVLDRMDEKIDLETDPQSSSTAPHTVQVNTSTQSGDVSQTFTPAESSLRTRISVVSDEYTRALQLVDLGRQLAQSKLVASRYLSTHRSESFHPADHQKIIVQEAVVCMNPTSGLAAYTCQGPLLRAFSYYSPGDQSVGQMIQMVVASRGELCPTKGCGQLKSFHQTEFIHRRLKASLRIHHPQASEGTPTPSSTSSTPLDEIHSDGSLDPTLEAGNEDLILMQGYCPQCDGHTRKTEMSDDSWRLSFGKYLELCFYSQGIHAEVVTHRSTGLRLPCTHDLHLDHTRMFFYRGFRIDFSVQRINVYEAITPSMCLLADTEAQFKVLTEEYSTISKRSEAFFQSVRNRINGFNYDVVTIDKQDASEEAMRELMRKVELDAQLIQLQLDEVHLACVGTNGVKINTVRKTLVDKAVEWDHLFASFESKFMAGDGKDARRLTSVQLRKLFVDQNVMPGSPDRLFSRIQQLPAFNAHRHNYTSQSEVDSDHAGRKTSHTVSFKKAFPSPTLKNMASALAFALPTSMPTLGLPEGRVDLSLLKSKGTANLESESSSINTTSPEQSGTIEPKGSPTDKLNEAKDPTQDISEIDSALRKKVEADSAIVSSSNSTSKELGTDVEATKALTKDSPETPTVESSQALSSFVSPTSVQFVISSPAKSVTEPSPKATPKARVVMNRRPGSDLTVDCEDGFKSDATIINARDRESLVLKPALGDRHSNPQDPSDTDTTNHSEAESLASSKRLTIRGRRILEVGPSKNGVANLVQRFERPGVKELRLTLPVTSEEINVESEIPKTRSNEKGLKVSGPPTRPLFRRGKSEIVRSTSQVARGKRPVGQIQKSLEDTNFSSRKHAADSVEEGSNRNNSIIKLAPRHHARSNNSNQLSSKLGPHPKTPSTGLRGDQLVEGPLRLAPRLNKPTNSHRNRPDSGLPISSTYLSRRNNGHNPKPNSKVSTITRQFDRMSREADRQKHGINHRSRPRPIAHAKSSVHAFSSLTAAVHEDPDSDLDESNVNPAEHDADDEGDVTPEVYGPEAPDPSGTNLAHVPSPLASDFTDRTSDEVHPLETSPGVEECETSQFADSSMILNRADRPMIAQTTPCSPSFVPHSFRLPPSGLSQFSDNEMSSGEAGRHSIIKTLSSLWSYRGAEFLTLEYPQLPTEHQSAENPVLIREDEPSSIIAYTLASKLYSDTLKDTEPRVIERSEIFMPEDVMFRGPDPDSTWGMIDFAPHDTDMDEALKMPPNSNKPMQFRFDVSPCTVTCKVFFMHQFEALRKTLGCKDIFESLSRCHKWDASGGKSGQTFLRTKDGRYLIKGISKTELEALTKFAPAYFEYLASASRDKRPIALAKMLGIFQISFLNKTTNRKGRLQVQVIENLWLAKSDLHIYDLKGLTRNRTVHVTGRPNEVLLDGNFCEMTRTNPIFVHKDSLLRLQASLHNDTLFLASNNVMDYSLAIGIDQESQELYVGIIDYLRTYSWDKRLETLVKELGGSSKEAPTIITPSLYKARFRRAMARYFMVSPDAWLQSWKPYLLQSDEEIDRDGIRSSETGGKNEDNYIDLFCN
ncbi:uncharacterized protein MELLADRAFT_116024 [Melampsora larici-populina 98AG31]|uniref:1-phosphatidylinositol-3-phosphate 5-kinase n=1 Tax=Melampsora larici-populina (strain 98AG31 / pathotype 3-4-7) TaxID=747676 RepID=F4RGR2_MELLP|nr:uncharacterized protein MELLADRAFT_116024 [Melampsora larici-populina 98AG31]EGG08575.1 hypothetical protein MELLADRAFT_116024 [Melampsora larici-populina 98AG31]